MSGAVGEHKTAASSDQSIGEETPGSENLNGYSSDVSSGDDAVGNSFQKQQYHIIESIEDLRHIRERLYTIMQNEGEAGHAKCSAIVEDAIQEKVKIIKRSQKTGNFAQNSKIHDYFRKLAEQWLIDGFADLEVEDANSSKSPLHYAAELGSKILVDALLLPFQFCRYRMANVSNSRGQTAIFPLLLNLDMAKKGIDSPHSDLVESDVERRRKLLIRLVQVGLSFSHADNDNKSVLHYMREYRLRNRHDGNFAEYASLVKVGNVESNNSVEIKFVLKSLSSLFIRDGKTALRKQSVAISKSKYNSFFQKLNGIFPTDDDGNNGSSRRETINATIDNFSNCTYIYKRFPSVDYDSESAEDIVNRLESESGQSHTYRRDTMTMANKASFSRSSRSEKNLCHVLFSDGSAPKYNLYFPLTVGKILFFSVKNDEKITLMQQPVFPINCGNKEIEHVCNTTMKALENMWHNYDPCKRLARSENHIVKIDYARMKSLRPVDVPKKNSGHSGEVKSPHRTRPLSFEEEDKVREVFVSYIKTEDVLKNELDALTKEMDVDSLTRLCKSHGLVDSDFEMVESLYRLAVEYSIDVEKPDKRLFLAALLLCKHIGFAPVQTFFTFYASYLEEEMENDSVLKEDEENRTKLKAFDTFRETVYNQWARNRCMMIDFFDTNSSDPVNRRMPNSIYAFECWGIKLKEVLECRKFCMHSKYVEHWRVHNLKITSDGVALEDSYVKTRRLIELHGMLRIIHGKYVLSSIQNEFRLFLACSRFEGLCRAIDTLVPQSGSVANADKFDIKRLDKVLDKISVEYVGYLNIVRERRKLLDAQFYEDRYQSFVYKIKKVFKQKEDATAAIAKLERFFDENFGVEYAMERFELLCFQRYASGPHSIHLEFKDGNENVHSIVKRRSGMWRAQKLYENEIESKETETARMRQSRSNTAAYFLREVVRTALEAGCGNEVCSCVNEIGCNLLEIIEAAPNLSQFLGKESQPTLSLIYQNLLLAASKYANEKKATRLIETLIAKKVNVLKLARDPTTNPLNFAADRRMLRASSVLIKAGATVTVNALEALFNALEGQEYYEKRIELEQGSNAEAEKTSFRESIARTNSARARKQNGLKRTLSKQQIDSLFKHNGENVKSILRKQVLFHGAESGTLTSSIVHYMIEDSMTKAKNDFDVCDTDEYGATAMHYASMNGHHRTIIVLAECGGRNCMNRRDDNIHRTYGGQVFYKPLPMDTNDYLKGDVFAESTYRRRTITSYHEKYKGYTPLALAVQNGHVECVRVLLDLGADPFLRDINKMLPNPHLVDPTCPYWLTLGIRLPSLPIEDIEDEKKKKGNESFLYVCALNQKTVRRPQIPTVQGFDSVFQRSHGRRSVMNAHFKGQLDSILLVEQRRRSRRKMYKKFIRQWYDVVLRDGVRSIVDRRLEDQEKTMVNYGKSEGVKHVEATFASQHSTEDGVTSLMTGTSFSTLQERRDGINLLMRKHPAVHLMRTRYGTYRFFIYLIYYMSSLFFPMVFCIFLLNAGEGVNQMRERIQNELGEPSRLFHTIDYDKNNFYNWLENGLLKQVIPALETDAYVQVGKPKLEIRRMRDYTRRWNSSNKTYQDYQPPFLTVDAAFQAKNFSNTGWGGPSPTASLNCAKNSSCLFNFEEEKFLYKLNIEEDFENQTKFLKDNSFLDKYTYSVDLKFVFYSFSTGSYCRTTVVVKYTPSKLAVTDITYYVFTTNLNFRRGNEISIRFHHVCLAFFVLIMMNEIWALFLTYYWSCRGPCLRVKRDYERRRKGDIFWDNEMHEDDHEDEGVSFGRGRGISVVNVRPPRRKSNGSMETPWERKMNRARRKSEAKIRKELMALREEKKRSKASSVRKSAIPKSEASNPVENRRKALRRAQTASEGTSTIQTSNIGITLTEVKNEKWSTWASVSGNIRTQVREHMQELLGKATTSIVSTHRDSQTFHYSARDILQLWFLRLKIAYENKQILDLLYVLAGTVLISFIFYFMRAVDVFETKMKLSDNSKYLDEIDEAVQINQSLRLLFIVFTGSLVTKIAKFAKIHPVFGKFILAIAQVIVSNSITHFLMLYMGFYLMMILCYHVMFGDVVVDFADFLRTAMTLVRLGVTGEHEEGTMMPDNSPYMDFYGTKYIPRLLLLLFMLLSILFAMNLFIAIITAEWSKYVDADLWDAEIDNELRLHVEYNHAGLIFDNNPVLGWLIKIWRDQHIVLCGKKRLLINCFKRKVYRRSNLDEIDVSDNSINERGNTPMNRKSRMSRLRAISYSTS